MAHSKPIVLVVEDETLVRVGIADHLEDEGFTVLEAASADEALAILANNQDVRIVFTDVDMPGTMDGIKLAAAVRNRWPPITIVVTSGHRRVNASELPQGTQFVRKPYDPDELVASFRDIAKNCSST